ncbi:MAG: hypothetical protein HOV96_11315 [Nonomuraea sp.]|nr:hypothetical protein [Nonomuraea sp.]
MAWRLLTLLAAGGIACPTLTIGRPWAYFTVQSNLIPALYCGSRRRALTGAQGSGHALPSWRSSTGRPSAP